MRVSEGGDKEFSFLWKGREWKWKKKEKKEIILETKNLKMQQFR